MADNGSYGSRWSSDGRDGDGVLFTNVRILDGTGEYPYTGEVLVQGKPHQIDHPGSQRFGRPAGGGATVIDGMGAT